MGAGGLPILPILVTARRMLHEASTSGRRSEVLSRCAWQGTEFLLRATAQVRTFES